ncbi:hypothetical protein IJG14_07970 [bacterium]|nr:hypothetical protein [bacterium]
MQRYATAFVLVWCILSIICTIIVFHLTMYDNSKMAQFILVNSLFLVALGIFFAIFRNQIFILLDNYKREKEI